MKLFRINRGNRGSSAGFIIGLFLFFVGLFGLVPRLGLLGVFWTLVALGITLINAAAVVAHRSAPRLQSDDPDEEGLDPLERIQRLYRLYERQEISKEEYEARRAEIMKHL